MTSRQPVSGIDHNVSPPSGRCSLSLARALVVAAVVTIVAACAGVPGQPTFKPESTGKTIRSASDPNPDDQPVFETQQEEQPGILETEIYPGTGRFIDEEAAENRVFPVSEDGEIVLNFEGESIQSVVHTILGEVLQETFVIGPGVSGQVTFSTSRPVTREQLMPILELLLR